MMQSYSQIRDPNLRIGQLKSLGERLDLPTGWHFRTRRLRHGLTLKATGKATIVQDDLLNTYQREPARLFSPHRTRHRVALTGKTRTVGSPSPGVLEDQGTISGDPFGTGTIDLVVTFNGSKVTGPFRIKSPSGSANGRFWMDYAIEGGEIDFDGTACFASGTGTYRGIRGSGLEAHDHNTLDGQNGEVSLKGFATYCRPRVIGSRASDRGGAARGRAIPRRAGRAPHPLRTAPAGSSARSWRFSGCSSCEEPFAGLHPSITRLRPLVLIRFTPNASRSSP